MQGSWHTRGLRGGLRRSLQAAALMSLLAGCSFTDDLSNSLFGGGSGSTAAPQPVAGPGAASSPQTTAQTTTPPAQTQTQTQTQTYPNLSSVPSKAPTTSTPEQRQQTASGLIADNQNAAYSQQPVAPQPAGEGSVAPPPPAPVPAAGATTGTDTATASAQAAPAAAPTTMSTDTVSTAGVTTTNATPPASGQATVAETTPPAAPAPEASAPAPEAPAPAPEATAMPQPVAPPATTAGVTPLAPPPNPIPPASQTATATATYGNESVMVDTSQLGSVPLPYYTSAGPVAGSGQPIAVIFFGDGSAALSGRGMTVLHDVYLIQQQQGGHLRIVGNASMRTATLDPSQHDQVNYELSQKRANAVARALINMGVPDGSIGVMAQGSQRPVFYEFMPTGEAGNRRVEIYLDR